MSISATDTIKDYQYTPQSIQRKPANKKDPIHYDVNPISRKGEAVNLIKATFIGGLVLAARFFYLIIENGDWAIEDIAIKAKELVNKNKKGLDKNQKILYSFGAFASLTAAAFTGFALLYTAYNAPKIAYKSKVNAYTKSKEMDVYTRSNYAERELYSELAEKAKNASPEEREALKEQYLQMRMAKNRVPDFVKQKKN